MPEAINRVPECFPRCIIDAGLANHIKYNGGSFMDNQSLSHSRYNCTYHIIFIPKYRRSKYRRKVMFGELRKDVGEAISKVCKMEGVSSIMKYSSLFSEVAGL
ncbi:MAG: transposase, partial [Clostridiales bacterium]|nr:transposase [Clostridiales bacterium]